MRRASRTVTARIHRLVGQLNAIETMVVNKRSCTEILSQVAAVRAGVESVAGIVFQRELERLANSRKVTPGEIAKLTKLFSQIT